MLWIVTWNFYSFSHLTISLIWIAIIRQAQDWQYRITRKIDGSIFTFPNVNIDGFVYDVDILTTFPLFNFIFWQCPLDCYLKYWLIFSQFHWFALCALLVDSRNFMSFRLVFTLAAITRELPNHKENKCFSNESRKSFFNSFRR